MSILKRLMPMWRIWLVLGILMLIVSRIGWQLYVLHFNEYEVNQKRIDLQQKGNSISVRHEEIITHRGAIFDRNGEPLAVSVPVSSLFFNGEMVDLEDNQEQKKWQLAISSLNLHKEKINLNSKNQFNYLVRQIYPDKAKQILDLKIKGLYSQKEYKRFYPAGNLAAHVLGLTDIDDLGLSGLEYAYNELLVGKPGRRRIVKSVGEKNFRILENEQITVLPSVGKDLVLSLDLRLQYIAERELDVVIKQRNAKAGVILIADVTTGELLAVANNPTYNPNNLNFSKVADRRNVAFVDAFEIGSAAKPFSMLAALQSGKWHVNDTVDVWPFRLLLKGQKDPIADVTRNNGHILDSTKVLINSSNVGMSKIALKIGGLLIYHMFQKVGLGQTLLGLPGERLGIVPAFKNWLEAETAALSYGYGVTVNAVQLLQAYTVIANDGVMRPLTLIARTKEDLKQIEQQVLDPTLVRKVKQMLSQVVLASPGPVLAQVPNYTVAGKSGTSRKHIGRGYSKSRHSSIFVGFAPAQNARYAVLVFIDEPYGEYLGGKVAAPVFSKVMGETLRLMNVPADNLKVASK